MTIVKCPRCGYEEVYEGNEFRPFCSERCKMIDFGDWADEKFRFPGQAAALNETELSGLESAKNNDGID